MRRFIRDNIVMNTDYPEEYQNIFQPLLHELLQNTGQRGTIKDTLTNEIIKNIHYASRNTDYRDLPWYDLSMTIVPMNESVYTLNEVEHICLKQMYQKIFPNNFEEITVPHSARKLSDVMLFGDHFGSGIPRSKRSSFVTAFWCGASGEVQDFNTMYLTPRPGKVSFYIRHAVIVNNERYEHILACVEWYLPCSEPMKNFYGKPVELWKNNLFELHKSAKFMPIQRIKSKFVHVPENINGSDVLVVLPRNRFLNI